MRLTWCILILFTLNGCKNDELTSSGDGFPQFYVDCNVDGIPLTMVADESMIYMHTDFEYVTDSNPDPIGRYSGKLSHYSNEQEPSLEIKLRNFRRGTCSSQELSQTLGLQNLVYYYPGVVWYYETSLTCDTNGSQGTEVDSVLWDFGDGQTFVSTDLNVNHFYPYYGPWKYNVCMTTYFSGCASDYICTEIAMPSSPLKFDIELLPPSGDFKYTFKPQDPINGAGPFRYQWYFENDGISSYTKEVIYVLSELNVYVETASLQVTDINGNQLNVSRQFPIGDPSECFANIRDLTNPNPVLIESQNETASVELIYKDENGRYFYSQLSPQNNSEFKILRHGSYLKNEASMGTQYLEFQFNCQLQDTSGTVLQLNNGLGRFAIAHP